MLFIYLYHGDLYTDLGKSDLYFRPSASAFLGLLTLLQSPSGLLQEYATSYSK